MRRRRSERDRTDEDPERGPASALEPGRHQLQGRRIDPGEEESRGETQRDAHAGTRCPDEEEIHGRRPQRSEQDDPPRGQDVREVEDAREERSRHETQLDRDREPRSDAGGQVPLGSKLWDHRRRGEPRRHPQDEGDRQEHQGPITPLVPSLSHCGSPTHSSRSNRQSLQRIQWPGGNSKSCSLSNSKPSFRQIAFEARFSTEGNA